MVHFKHRNSFRLTTLKTIFPGVEFIRLQITQNVYIIFILPVI